MGYKSKLKKVVCSTYNWGPSWSYGSWINNYIYNQCLSPLTLWVRILLRRGILDATLCDKVCQRLATGRWFSPPKNIPPRYSWNIVESGVKHHTPLNLQLIWVFIIMWLVIWYSLTLTLYHAVYEFWMFM